MEVQYFKQWSEALGREMETKVYGHGGKPMLFIPCQDGRFFDFENFKMTDAWSPWLESGQVMVFAVDTVDKETWSDKWSDPYWRIRRYEQWIAYITDELVPFMRAMVNQRNGWEGEPGIMVFGCSLGATHALNLFLRRPTSSAGCWPSAASTTPPTALTATWTKGSISTPLSTSSPTSLRVTPPSAAEPGQGDHLRGPGRLGAAGDHPESG